MGLGARELAQRRGPVAALISSRTPTILAPAGLAYDRGAVADGMSSAMFALLLWLENIPMHGEVVQSARKQRSAN